ncbi:hypothetical protein ACF0H5_007740 [Mactra antiquata]
MVGSIDVLSGLFENENVAQELAFKTAIEFVNLNHVVGKSRMILYHVEEVIAHDSFDANKEVCRQMRAEEGIAAVFGPISKIPRAHVQSICNSFEIPHLNAQWDARDSPDYFSINVYPDYNILSRSYADIINYWGWKQFTIIYEDDDGLLRLQEVLKATKAKDHKITVRKIDPYQTSHISMFKDMKIKNEYHVIVDCDYKKVQPILHEALKVNMLSELYHFHFTTLDVDLVNLEDYKYSGANITAMRLIDPSNTHVIEVVERYKFLESSSNPTPLQGKTHLQTEVALMYDAVHLFAKALSELTLAQSFETVNLSCNKKQTWQYGNSLLNYMKSMETVGLSGKIRFDNGRRSDFKLDVIELAQSGLRKVGSWEPSTGINITTSYNEKKKENLNKLSNMTLRVTTVYDEPYVMLKANPKPGEPIHEGFIPDLLDLIKAKLNFNYTMYQVPDENYGNEQPDGTWDGMVGELMLRDPGKRADMAAAGMTITYEREEVVDFTKPFLNLGITILYKKPVKAPPELFSFLDPLSINVWIYMLAAYLCVSFMLFVIARFSPYEWTNPHPCNEDSDLVENQFTILNSLWFTIGSLMQQGCEIAPRAISTRIVACIWWFFTLIIISSYTANLAAFLTVERMVSPIESVDDLAKQTTIKYGTRNGGSTSKFFEKSDIPTYKRMWAYMSANPDTAFVDTNDEGYSKVLSSDYAYIGESITLDYQVQRKCDLTQVGGLLDSKGFGIAFPKDSPWTDLISREIIYFQENQQIQKLYNKWWKEKSGGKCDVETKKKDASALGVKHVGGVFVVLVGGLGAGLFIACAEFMWKARKNAKIDKQSFCSEISEELRFAVKCFGSSDKTTRRVASKEIVDNGIQFTPMIAMPNNRNQKELYA